MSIFNILRQSGKKEEELIIPNHIAVVMDGNGRWAKKRLMARTIGHKAGSETFRKIARYCKKIGVNQLTAYAFSTENWKRPQDEVNEIMRLLKEYLKEAAESMQKEGIAIRILGDLSALSEELQKSIEEIHELSNSYDCTFTANICINYGARDEIKNAVARIAQDVLDGKLSPDDISEDTISQNLYTNNIEDPDLVIRPSGEIRLSNFLLWQSAYSEFYFTDTLWPDFDEEKLDLAIIEFNKRNRRFGGV